MKRLITILSCVLLVQFFLTVFLFSNDQDMGVFQSSEKLVGLQLNELDGIVIEDAEQALTLSRQQDQWQIKEYFDSPVAASKLQSISDKIFGMHRSWPVATTESAATRFKVTDSQFERKISFMKDAQTLKTLYLGTSPGFKKIHARVDQQANIYSIDFSAYEFSTKAEDWVDQTLLHVNRDALQQIQMPALSLNRKDQVWRLEPLVDGHTEDQAAISQLLDTLTRLDFSAVAGVEKKTEYDLDNPALSITLTDKSGKQINFVFAKIPGQPKYILKMSRQPFYFETAELKVQAILDTNSEKLSKLKEDASADSPENDSDAETDSSGDNQLQPE